MPNDRLIRETILTPTGSVIAAGKYLYSLDGEFAALNDEFNVGDIVFYDPRTNITVGAGATATTTPRLGVAVCVDKEGKGYPTVLRKVFGDSLNSKAISRLTTEPPSYGCNQIEDFYSTCTFKGESYSIEIQTRGDEELSTHNWNQWKKEIFTVNLKDFACETCENGIDTQAVFCALAKKINAHKRATNPKAGKFLQRALKMQSRNRSWTAYPIFQYDCTYTITNSSPEDCAECTHISGINGITIGENDPVVFGTAALVDLVSLSLRSKKERIVALINKAFKDAGVEGSAVIDEQLTGSGAPCADFKIRINSCVEFDLFDSEDEPLVKVCANPLTAITIDPECVGCSDSSTWTPTGGIRVVSHSKEITCDCTNPVDRTYWFHREIRIGVPESMNNWTKFVTKTIQKPKSPQNLGVQWRRRIMDMSNGGPGYSYDNWVNDLTGIYYSQRKGTAFTESYKGLECKDGFCSINIHHGLPFNDTSVNGELMAARGRSIILINNTASVLYAAVKAVLDPWFSSIGYTTGINCGTDVDQISMYNFDGDTPSVDANRNVTADSGQTT